MTVVARHTLPVDVTSSQTVALTPVGDALRALDADDQLLLVLRGVKAEHSPGVLFQLSLKLDGARDASTIGTINFFRAQPTAAPDDLFESFDVTAQARRLSPTSRAPMSVIITPIGQPAPQSHPTIARIELVRQ